MFTLNRKGATTIVDEVLLGYLIEDDMEDPEVPTEHLHEELHHHAEHSREKWVLGVALSSALLAGFAAVCSLMAGHHANEAMISQIESTDQWGYFQSKGIKETALTSKAEILDALGKPVSAGDKEKVMQYQRDKELIAKKADELEKDAQTHLRTHEVLASSVTMFQIAIAVGAISVLIRSRPFWLISLALGVVGIAFLIQSFFTAGGH